MAKLCSLPYNEDIGLMHDYWIALNVAKNGIVENVKEQTILYRQHGNNEAGAGNEFHNKNINTSNFASWYIEIKPLLKYFHYTNMMTLIFNRFIYFIRRHFT